MNAIYKRLLSEELHRAFYGDSEEVQNSSLRLILRIICSLFDQTDGDGDTLREMFEVHREAFGEYFNEQVEMFETILDYCENEFILIVNEDDE